VDIDLPTPAPAPPPPRAVAVQHSRSYLLKQRRDSENEAGTSALSKRPRRDASSLNGNAVEHMIRRVDQTLDDIEVNPPEYVSTFHNIASSEAGVLAGAALRQAAKASIKIGGELAKQSVPAARWLAAKGLDVAVGAAKTLNENSAKDRRPRTSEERSAEEAT